MTRKEFAFFLGVSQSRVGGTSFDQNVGLELKQKKNKTIRTYLQLYTIE